MRRGVVIVLKIFSQVKMKRFKSNIWSNIQPKKITSRKWNFFYIYGGVLDFISLQYKPDAFENSHANSFHLGLSIETYEGFIQICHICNFLARRVYFFSTSKGYRDTKMC